MNSTGKTKLLIIGDAAVPTGFARVIREIFDPICDQYDIHQLATRYDGSQHDYRWKLYPANENGSPYGYDRLPALVSQIKPEIIFVLYDFVFLIKYAQLLSECQSDAKLVLYCPIESGPIAPQWIRQLHGVSRFVLFTQYGRQVINESLGEARQSEPDFSFPIPDIIPHGLDQDRFFPIRDTAAMGRRQIARAALGMDDDEHREAFIVLNANRNMPRKRIDLTIEGFAEFARDKPPGVKLYLHMATEDTGWNVLILAKRHGIDDRLIMSRADNQAPGFSDQQLNLLYNACDVGITTTTGEGWGMVAFEHAATRAAQVMPNHTSLSELWKGAAEFVQPFTRLTYPGNLTHAHLVSPQHVAQSLQRLYEDPLYRDSIAEAAYQNATQNHWRWGSVSEKWQQLFKELEANEELEADDENGNPNGR